MEDRQLADLVAHLALAVSDRFLEEDKGAGALVVILPSEAAVDLAEAALTRISESASEAPGGAARLRVAALREGPLDDEGEVPLDKEEVEEVVEVVAAVFAHAPPGVRKVSGLQR
eukprot:8332554-Pyramimonas_sp.AAC.1